MGILDLLEILVNWGDPYGITDLVLVLSNWGACPCDGTVPDTIEETVDCMGLETADWEDFEYTMQNGSVGEKENYACWMSHYLDVHCNGTCLCAPDCPDDDPWGGH